MAIGLRLAVVNFLDLRDGPFRLIAATAIQGGGMLKVSALDIGAFVMMWRGARGRRMRLNDRPRRAFTPNRWTFLRSIRL